MKGRRGNAMRLVITVTLAAAAVAAGCATAPEEQAPAGVEERAAKPPAPVETKPVARVDLTSKPVAGSPLKDPKNILSRRSIYYRSEERRVGKECRSRWSPYILIKNNEVSCL